jgi:hypothetical protein
MIKYVIVNEFHGGLILFIFFKSILNVCASIPTQKINVFLYSR